MLGRAEGMDVRWTACMQYVVSVLTCQFVLESMMSTLPAAVAAAIAPL